MTRPSREAVSRWNLAYAEQTTALLAAMRSTSDDLRPRRRLVLAYHELAESWRALAADFAAPLWARTASSVAAEEFDRRARTEQRRLDNSPGTP